jgi:hypothetical protein
MKFVAQKVLRLAGPFAHRNPIVQYPDRRSWEDPVYLANRNNLLAEGSLIGYVTVYGATFTQDWKASDLARRHTRPNLPQEIIPGLSGMRKIQPQR